MKIKTRRVKFWLFIGLTSAVSLRIYHFIYPPLPPWIKPPPGSSVLMTRRFIPFAYFHGPRYYGRIYSPLSARRTAAYFIPQSEDVSQRVRVHAFSAAPATRVSWFRGYSLEPPYERKVLSIDFKPNEIYSWIGGSEVQTLFLIWPKTQGSTIEIFVVGGF